MDTKSGAGASATPEAPRAQQGPFAGPSVRGVPAGYHAVTPWIISRDTGGPARLRDGGVRGAGAGPGGVGRGDRARRVRIGDSVVMAFDARPGWPDTPAFLRLYVADGDATFRQALAAGATAVTEMTSLFWGDRVGRVRDPLGNLWWIQTRVEDLDPAEMERRAGLPEYVAAMAYVQGADFFAADAGRRGPARR